MSQNSYQHSALVKDIKAAEAAAMHKAREALVLAEARQQAAELDTRAKIRLSGAADGDKNSRPRRPH